MFNFFVLMPQFIKALDAEISWEYVKILRYFSLRQFFSKEERRPRVETNGDILHEESNKKVNVLWNLTIPLFSWLSPCAYKGSNTPFYLAPLILIIHRLRMTGKPCSWCVWPTKLVGNSLTRETLQSSRSAFSKIHSLLRDSDRGDIDG